MKTNVSTNYSAVLFNSSFGYEGRRDGLTLVAAKRYLADAQRKAGYGWHAEISGPVNYKRAHGARNFVESI